jgi:S1-C subfamily serine protease
MEDLLEYGEVRRGFLGVTIQAVDAALAEQEGLNVLKGAYISRIDGKLGAAEAGMRQGDVIVSVNGIEVGSAAELQEQVNRYRPGEAVRIRAYRGKEVRDFSVMLKDMKSGPLLAAESPETFEYRGATFRSLTADELRRLDIAGGVLVEQPGETLVRGGVQKGFVITDVNGTPVRTPAELEAALESAGEYKTMKGLYRRGVAASYSFNW